MARATKALAFFVCSVTAVVTAETTSAEPHFELTRDDMAGKLQVSAGGVELFIYNYGNKVDLPHFYPLYTPSGKNLLVQETQPYPHHRAFWVSDTVERDGVRGDIYNAYYSGVKVGDKAHSAPFDIGVRHATFEITTSTPGMAVIKEKLVWETSRTQTAYPLLDEHRDIKLYALDSGDYLMDFEFELRAEYGDVKFISDAVHYSWPYLRLNSKFSGDCGGTITADTGTTGQKATNMQEGLVDAISWIDYSNTVGGVAEGVALFQWPGSEYGTGPRKWLTREYGTFGPRRTDDKSGKPFTLKKGESISQRVGIYVHRGDVNSGKVAETFNKYVKGELN
jgi:hypothetical protein